MKHTIKDFAAVRNRVVELGKDLKKIFEIENTKERFKKASNIDIEIENQLVITIKQRFSECEIISEEQYTKNPLTESPTWILDPISGTTCIRKQQGVFAIVCSYVINSQVIYALVYDPLGNLVYEALKDDGFYVNKKKHSICAKKKTNHILLNHGTQGVNDTLRKSLWSKSLNLNPFVLEKSSALQYCDIATNKYDYIVTISKDNFPYFAASLIIKEAGGVFSVNNDETRNISFLDNVFEAAISREVLEEINRKLF